MAQFLYMTGVVLWGLLALGWAAGPVRQSLAENRLDEAIGECRSLDSTGVYDNDTLLACAWAYYRSDRIESAEKLMERLAKNPSLPEFQLLQAYAKMKKKQFAESRRLVGTLASEYRNGSFGLLVQEVNAEIYEAQGQLDTAAFLYKQMLGDDPTRARAHWGLGRFYLAKGEAARAKQHLEQTARLWPKHLGSRFNLAVLNLSQNNFSDAAKWLAECYKLDRSDPGVLEQMGILFEKKGMINEAIKYWQRALSYNKDSALAKEKLAAYNGHMVDALAQSKQYGEAIDRLNSSEKLSKGDSKFKLKRALLYRKAGKYEKAMGDLLAYSKTHGKDPLVQRELGICYLNTKLLNQAANSFMKAIELEPENGMNYAWLAFVLEGKGRFTDAREAWKKAIENMTDSTELERATRKLATIEKRIREKQRNKAEESDDKEKGEDKDIEKEMENMDVFEGVEGIPK